MTGSKETSTSIGGRMALLGKAAALGALILGGFLRPAEAIPTPGGFAGDTGVELLTPLSDPFLSIEIADLLGSGGADSEFGFYFAGAPGTLIPIFEPADQGPPDQTALVSLSGGLVIDGDEGAVQGSFGAVASDSTIGFYLTLFPGAVDALTLFTEPLLNPGGGDFAQVFQSLSDDAIFVNFEDFGTSTSLGQYIVSPMAAVVSEPSATAAFGVGLLGLLLAYRRRQSGPRTAPAS